MALPPPTCIYTYVLIDGVTHLTYWKSQYINGAWTTPPVNIFDSGAAATFTYSQTAGATSDGTHLGLMLSHSVSPPDVSTLEFLGDGLPATPIDVSNSNTLFAASPGLPTGGFWLNNVYYGLFVTTSDIRVMTSATGSAPWTELDGAHRPTFTLLPNGGSARVNVGAKKIDLFAQTGTGFFCHIFLYTFDLATLTWSAKYGDLVINMGVGGSIFVPNGISPWSFGESVGRFPNGDIFAIYQRFPSGFAGPWVWRLFNGTSWGSEVTLSLPQQNTNGYAQTIIDPASPETLHVWAHNGNFGHADTFTYFTVTHAGVVSGALYTTRTMDLFSAGGMGHGINTGGTQYVPITDPALTSPAVWIGSNGAFTETHLPIPTPDIGVTPNVGSYMVDILTPSPVPALGCPVGGGTATIGVPYSATLIASGGTPPYTFFIVAGGLPPGLSLNSTTGVISGTPLISGTFTYTVEVIDANGLTAQVTCTITIPSAPGPPTGPGLLCPTTTTVLIGQSYSFQVIVIGGTPPYTFALVSGQLPPGLTLNTSTGVISGTATASGTYTYQIKVTDANGNTSTATCVLTSSQCPGAL